MAQEQDKMPPIEAPSERWEPKSDPSQIEVPELNTSASLQEQLEQLDQIITIRLQNIDANMSRAHYILSEKILPAVKRFNSNTEPVREAARFWIQLFEQAAKIRIPGPEDISFGLQPEEAQEEMPQDEPPAQGNETHDSQMFDPNVTPSDNSFAPENAAVSSTPMVTSASRPPESDSDAWSASVESPLERIDKGLKSLGEDDTTILDSRDHRTSQDSVRSETSSVRTPVFKAPDKGKGKEKPTLLQNVLTKNTKAVAKDHTSPLKIRKTPKKNPFAPANGSRSAWDGIVDLTKHQPQSKEAVDSSDWSSEDEMDFPPPQRSPAKRVGAHIGRTPKKEAAARIGRDLIGDVERIQQRHRHEPFGNTSEDQTLSTPSLSNYSKRALGIESTDDSTSHAESSHSRNNTFSDTDQSIGEAVRNIGLNVGQARSGHGEGGMGDDSFDDSFDDTTGPVFQGLNTLQEDPGNDSSDSSDEDSFVRNNAGPSAAFLLASARQRRETGDSFGGSDHSSDSLDNDDRGGAPIHPFAHLQQAQGDESFDDSFDDDGMRAGGADESTVFGVRPVPRAQRLTLHGQHFIDDTVQLTDRLEPGVPETPTPANALGDNR